MLELPLPLNSVFAANHAQIVSMDPWGHDIIRYFKPYLDKGYDIRPTIAGEWARQQASRANVRLTDYLLLQSPGLMWRSLRLSTWLRKVN